MHSLYWLTVVLVSAPSSAFQVRTLGCAPRVAHIFAREFEPLPDLKDELKVRFDRDLGETKTSFVPTVKRPAQKEAERPSQNEILLAEIRALQPKEKPPPPQRAPVDVSQSMLTCFDFCVLEVGAFLTNHLIECACS